MTSGGIVLQLARPLRWADTADANPQNNRSEGIEVVRGPDDAK